MRVGNSKRNEVECVWLCWVGDDVWIEACQVIVERRIEEPAIAGCEGADVVVAFRDCGEAASQTMNGSRLEEDKDRQQTGWDSPYAPTFRQLLHRGDFAENPAELYGGSCSRRM